MFLSGSDIAEKSPNHTLHYLAVAFFECFFHNNAAHLFCPVVAIWFHHTRVGAVFHIWAVAGHFPAIGKFYGIAHWKLTLSGEVILSITIKISTQATNIPLHSQISHEVHPR